MINRGVWLKILLNLVAFINLAHCDCGLPGIPFNAQIDRLSHIYYEGETIEYRCQLEGLRLLGNNTRKCIDSEWVGAIPRCVEELTFGSIKSIETRKNFTNWSNEYSDAAYFGGKSREKCVRSRRTRTWKVYFFKAQRHISYLEIVLYNRNNQFDEKLSKNLIQSVKINELRECSTETPAIDSTSSTVRINVSCNIQFDGDSIYEVWERDSAQFISMEFGYNDVTVCEIRIFSNSFMPFHRCGSADVVPHSSMEFIKSGNKYGRNSYYRYKCDTGFAVQGSEDVRCGLNNQWLDQFPSCRPLITCPFPPSTHESISVETSFEYLFSYSGNISAIGGSIATYSCVNNNSLMLGDSVRVCGEDGKWSGIDPLCIDNVITSEHYEQYIKKSEPNSTILFNAFSLMNAKEQQKSNGCGIPAMPYFAKPTSEKGRIFGTQCDVRQWYENGSIIHYQCESAYRWVTGDVDDRVCVNGSWIGRVGKCAVNWGNKISLKSINVYDVDNSGKSLNKHTVLKPNDTKYSHWDEHFAYRRDPEKNNCATFTVDTKHKWVLTLNQSTIITYFSVMLHPGGFFGFKRKINDPNVLKDTPITAEIGDRSCQLSSVWDYTHGKIGTFFFFTCDLYESKSRYQAWDSFINIYIDPKLFGKDYKTNNISICSLAVMVSKDVCGTPDIPIHAQVKYNSAKEQWVYTCDKGYKLIGSSSVKCGRNGRWIDQFPVCQLSALCHISGASVQREQSVNYENLDVKQSATKYSLSNYSCADGLTIVGSSLRVCTENGVWSGSEPQCIDLSSLASNGESSGKSCSMTAVIVGLFLLILLLAIVGLYLAYKRELISLPKLSDDMPPHLRVESADTGNSIHSISGNHVPSGIANGTNGFTAAEPNHTFYDINEELPAFSNGTEFLVESSKHSNTK